MNATLAGFSEADFRSFALALLIPALGYATLHILNIPLSKLPGISVEHKYHVPRWLLPFVTLSLTFMVGFLAAAYLTLRFHTEAPDRTAFEEHYHELRIDLTKEMPAIKQGDLLILRIAELEFHSDLRVYVNNVSMFGTHYRCIFRRQCDPRMIPMIDLTRELRLPTNRIDIHQENSGRRNCKMVGRLLLLRQGRTAYTYDVAINQDGKSTFHLTNPDNPSYAVCGRITISVPGRHS